MYLFIPLTIVTLCGFDLVEIIRRVVNFMHCLFIRQHATTYSHPRVAHHKSPNAHRFRLLARGNVDERRDNRALLNGFRAACVRGGKQAKTTQFSSNYTPPTLTTRTTHAPGLPQPTISARTLMANGNKTESFIIANRICYRSY